MRDFNGYLHRKGFRFSSQRLGQIINGRKSRLKPQTTGQAEKLLLSLLDGTRDRHQLREAYELQTPKLCFDDAMNSIMNKDLVAPSRFNFAIVLFGDSIENSSWAYAQIRSLRQNGKYDGLIYCFLTQPTMVKDLEGVEEEWTHPPGIRRLRENAKELTAHLYQRNLLVLNPAEVCVQALPIHFEDLTGSPEAGPAGGNLVRPPARNQIADQVDVIDPATLFVNLDRTEYEPSELRRWVVEQGRCESIPYPLLPADVRDYRRKVIENRRAFTRDPRYERYDGQNKIANRKIAQQSGCRVPELYRVFRKGDNIDLEGIPEPYVLKPSHLNQSKGIFMMPERRRIKDAKVVSKSDLLRQLDALLEARTHGRYREKNYHSIEPAIMAEQAILTESPGKLRDWEFMTIHGRVMYAAEFVNAGGRVIEHCFFDRNGKVIALDPIELSRTISKPRDSVPEHFIEARDWAERLAGKAGLPSMRVGFKPADDGIYFTEFTLHSGDGQIYTFWMALFLGLKWSFPDLSRHLELESPHLTPDNKWKVLLDVLDQIENRATKRAFSD